ncbi:hypothetical protein ACQPYK_33760 [Streptosporangium sp. CA-135522]|uniref:hypothetical protein n=1 Tax=Streptosporangium sp. CA-135522 TaxID=3240072 RepID=UPI003D94E316
MHEEFSTREIWPLECLHCRHVWQEEYLVRRSTDGHGHDVVLWTRSGILVQPPWSGLSCPGCGDSSVKAFPAGDRSHRGVATGAPVPLAVAEPGSAPPPVADPGSDPNAAPEATPEPTRVPVSSTVGVAARRVRVRAGKVRVRVKIPARGRHAPPILFYALAGIAFLLLAGFELVGHVVTHH